MNQGIFGFPTAVSGSIISVTEFDASGTYTISEDATSIEILLVGGGGGGGGGARNVNATTSVGGGGGGSGGGAVHHVFYKNDFKNIRNLIITIGLGGDGGVGQSGIAAANGQAGQPGGFSQVISSSGELSLLAPGGINGSGGSTTSGTGSGGGVARNFMFGSIPSALQPGGNGSVSLVEIASATAPYPSIIYSNFRSNQGAGGGGGGATNTTSFPGGSIKLTTATTEVYIRNINFAGITAGITASYGGQINLGATLGKGQDGVEIYKLGAGFQYFSGFGGAGGGGANTVGGGNGGDGYRGGGGGGGGGVRTATALQTGVIPSGAGGKGGNGYCRIIARK